MIKLMYFGNTRIIQWDPEFSCFDKDVVYKLRSGTFTFSSCEFSNTYRVNSRGCRDDENSLTAPDIIVAGDSFAMGWGVDQNKTFADIIEQRTKLKVLNMGMASYGTVREMMALNNADVSKLKYLIIQYQRNDLGENAAFARNKNSTSGVFMDKAQYDETVRYYQRSRRYYPGKYTLEFLKYYNIDDRGLEFNRENIRENEIKYFLNAILNAGKIDFSKTKMIIVETPPRKDFAVKLNSELKNGNYGKTGNIQVIDLHGLLGIKDFCVLNGHLKSKGHRKVAEEIIKHLN